MTVLYVGIAVLLLVVALVLERRRARRRRDVEMRGYYDGRTKL
jgi:uncharacterized membrane protein